MAFGDGEHTVRRPAGRVLIVSPEAPPLEADTLQCGHCGKHWLVQPGSGRRRGFCLRCNTTLCGAPACVERCRPEEELVTGQVFRGR